ncbi:hypothetical protein [Paraflavitalea speifideaquila]|uniref:hypothetical protein n=1 Tax=Paraflavitalea speifideaquila TaxID=3076558 RepID=UPI0028E969EA|nr:hypothetical protein [Paraflavitalea speifideiaquila]
MSKWVVAAIWTPIQRLLEISINTTADSFELVDRHNIMMYEWSATQKNLLFVSGHTHKPVFASLDHIDRLSKQLEKAIGTGDEMLAKSIAEDLEKENWNTPVRNLSKPWRIPVILTPDVVVSVMGILQALK